MTKKEMKKLRNEFLGEGIREETKEERVQRQLVEEMMGDK